MRTIENYLSEVLEIYRVVEENQNKINALYKEAKEQINNTVYDDERYKTNDKEYLKCIESYSTV